MKKEYLLKIMSAALCGAMLTQAATIPAFAEETAFAWESTESGRLQGGEETLAAAESDTEEPGAAEVGFEDSEDGEEISIFSAEPEAADGESTAVVSEDGETRQQGEASEENLEESPELFTDSADAAGTSDTALEGTCGEDGSTSVTWKLENGVLTISGTGAMESYGEWVDGETGETLKEVIQPWKEYRDQIVKIVIGEGVTELGMNAFMSCKNLTGVTVSSTLKVIGNSTFMNCSLLTDISLGSSNVELIATNAFYGTSITSLTLPKTLVTADWSAFNGMTKLTGIYVDAGNTVFQSKDGVLFSDNGQTLYCYPAGRQGAYMVPAGTTKIGEYSFCGSAVTNVELPDTVTEIGEGAFDGCTSLTEIPTISTNSGAGETTTDSTVTDGNNTTDQTSDTGQTEADSSSDMVRVNVSVHENYSKAFEVLTIVNQERAAAGLSALTMDQSLLETAMLRASETVLYWDHTRPSGQICFTAFPSGLWTYGENIAVGTMTASGVMNMWMNSEGHKANILGSDYAAIGIGCVTVGGVTYWVQCFGSTVSAAADSSSYADRDTVRTVSVKKDGEYYKAVFSLSGTTLTVGKTADIQVKWNGLQLQNSGVKAESSNSSVCVVENNTVRAVAPGTATIKVWFPGYEEKAAEITVTVTSSKTTAASKKFSKIRLSKTSYTYTGKALKPTVKVYVGSSKLAGKYYTVSYKNNKKVGYATVTIKGKGKYSKYRGTVTFKILPKKETLTKCKSTKKKTLTISWKKDTQVKGYQYQICRSKNFKDGTNKIYTISSNRKTSAVVKGLSSKKTYYVRVRSFKKVSGKYLYGGWSTVKKVRVK